MLSSSSTLNSETDSGFVEHGAEMGTGAKHSPVGVCCSGQDDR